MERLLRNLVLISVMVMLQSAANANICPDKTACGEGDTCCMTTSSKYGCCPFPRAVCCSDQKHCCPHGQTCDLQQSRCVSGSNVTADEKIEIIAYKPSKAAFSLAALDEPNGICPDHKRKCGGNETCCKMAAGYGCCPMPNAVCCSDKEHCCPSGTVCDTKTETCRRGENTPTGLVIIESGLQEIHGEAPIAKNVCPDKKESCEDSETCCQSGSSSYSCCPFSRAVCCSDRAHCCPEDTTCDLVHERCIQNVFNMVGQSDAYEPESANSVYADETSALPKNSVVCPNSYVSCPDGTTCCLLGSGDYGCCPFPNAICCNDHSHCCPSGSSCDLLQEKCVFPFHSIPWGKKTTAKKTAEASPLINSKPIIDSVVCPNSVFTCAPSTTCCEQAAGIFSCCPLNNAVCCLGGKFCCPSGTVCDESGICKMLNYNDVEIPWLTKKRAQPRIAGFESGVVCPGGKTQCEEGQTCCRLTSGEWGCCPMPNATCCSDHEHCCPHGFKCTAQASCVAQS